MTTPKAGSYGLHLLGLVGKDPVPVKVTSEPTPATPPPPTKEETDAAAAKLAAKLAAERAAEQERVAQREKREADLAAQIAQTKRDLDHFAAGYAAAGAKKGH